MELCRTIGFEVYDFKDPEGAFNWADIDPGWENWTYDEYIRNLDHPAALKGFDRDMTALEHCDILLLVTPCGNSAHLEAGYVAGMRKPVYALMMGRIRPDLMYHMFDDIFRNFEEVSTVLSAKYRELDGKYQKFSTKKLLQDTHLALQEAEKTTFVPPHYGFETKQVTSELRKFEHRSGRWTLFIELKSGQYRILDKETNEDIYVGTAIRDQSNAIEILKKLEII